MVIFSFTHASVNNGAWLCEALEAHHHPLAWKAWSTCVGTVRQAWTSWVQFSTEFFFCFFL